MALWTPAEITTALWLDADDSTTITLTALNEMTAWNDKSGNLHHATMSTENWAPTLIVAEQNGLDVARLDSSLMDLDISLVAGDFSIFIACNPSVATLNGTLAYFLDATTGRFILAQLAAASDPRNKVSFYDGAWDYMSSATTGGQILNYQLTASATVLRNGTQIGTGTYTQKAIGGTVKLFSQAASNANHAVGDIWEIILLEGIPTETDRQKIEGYLAHKWGIESTLEAIHPYKSLAPGEEASVNLPIYLGSSAISAIYKGSVNITDIGLGSV